MSRHILVAMEMSASSEAALEFALDEYPDATITVLHVLESGDPLDLFAKPEPSEYIVPDSTTISLMISCPTLGGSNEVSAKRQRKCSIVRVG